MKKVIFLILFVFTFGIKDILSQVATELVPLSKEEIEKSQIVSGTVQSVPDGKVMACGGPSANDNWASAQTLVVNGGVVAGSSCGTTEPGETLGCNTTGVTVWYNFVATSSTQYVQIALVTGACYFGSSVYSVSTLPNKKCGNLGPISCQSSSSGPATQLYQLTNLTVGATYYIQIVYPSGGVCGSNCTFNIQVTSANPGGTITNPPPLTNCTAPAAGCFFGTPPTVNTVTSTCTSYPLAAAGYSANSVWSNWVQFTSSASWSNFSWQAIITSNCGAGNVVWLNWALYDCSCNQLACGDISTLTGNGLACGTCYRLFYQMELANCSSFTTIWPYQNVPSSPLPCTVLPLNLLYFNVTPNSKNLSAALEWKTASETDIREFRIERSADYVNFKTLASGIPAVGPGYNYSIIDKNLDENQAYYYKLIAINNNGKEDYSKTIVLLPQAKYHDINIVPNPAESSIDVILNETKTYSAVEIYNTLGQKVKSITNGLEGSKFSFDISDLSKGIYFVTVTTLDNEVIAKKLVKE